MPTIDRSHIKRILLFSGHMIDAAGREKPRFPPSAEDAARTAIAAAVEQLHVGPGDLGLTEGACGGDILFAESLLARGAALELRLPFPEQEFIEQSVAFPKHAPPPDRWVERFRAVRNHSRVVVRALPDERESVPHDENPYEQCNLWMLRDALAFGADRAQFLCLWNGDPGDGPGGTAHMMASIRQAGGKVTLLDTRKLWNGGEHS